MHAMLIRRLAVLSRKCVHDLSHALRHWGLAAPGLKAPGLTAPGLAAVRVKAASRRRRLPGR